MYIWEIYELLKTMKTKILLFAVALATSYGCSNNDDALCKCVEEGAKLDAFSKSLLEKKSVATKEEKQKLETLRQSMHKSCDQFKLMLSEDLQKRKRACKSLEFQAK